jgi:hypothetical protein
MILRNPINNERMAGQKAARSHIYSCGGLATSYVFLPVLSILAIDRSPPTER